MLIHTDSFESMLSVFFRRSSYVKGLYVRDRKSRFEAARSLGLSPRLPMPLREALFNHHT